MNIRTKSLVAAAVAIVLCSTSNAQGPIIGGSAVVKANASGAHSRFLGHQTADLS